MCSFNSTPELGSVLLASWWCCSRARPAVLLCLLWMENPLLGGGGPAALHCGGQASPDAAFVWARHTECVMLGDRSQHCDAITSPVQRCTGVLTARCVTPRQLGLTSSFPGQTDNQPIPQPGRGSTVSTVLPTVIFRRVDCSR